MALDPNKAIGADKIGGKFLHMAACGISRSLTSLFNSSLKCGDLPSEWKAALVTPVQKNGSSDLVGNYRPISVLPVVQIRSFHLRCSGESDLKAIDTWVKANKLNLNVQKMQLLVLSRRRREQETMEVQVVVDGKELKRSCIVKCLRVLLDDKLQ